MQELFPHCSYFMANYSLTQNMGPLVLFSSFPGCSEIHQLFHGDSSAELLSFSLSLPDSYSVT